jgi:hypothetical protein
MHKQFISDLKFLFVLPIITIILISGCIGPLAPSQPTGKGVVIQEWVPDFSQVNSAEPVKLQLKVQNIGDSKAENVEAEIIGIDVEKEWNGNKIKDLGDLQKPDYVSNTPGESKTEEWRLTAPKLPKGTDFEYEPIIRVSYDYITIAHKPITLVDRDELRRIIQQGKSLPSKPTTSSAGPLSVEIRTGDYVKTAKIDDPFPIYILITNDLWESGGSVIPKTGWGTTEKDYPVKVTIKTPEGTTLISSEKCSTTGVEIDLWQGKTAEITCEVKIDTPPEYRQEKLIEVKLDYRYYIDASTKIKVIGTGETGGLW